MKNIIYRKPQTQIDAETATGLIHSEYAVDIPSHLIHIEGIMDRIATDGGTSARIIEDADLPIDRLFRNAWDDSNPGAFVVVNMPKAAEIAHGLRRGKRAADFAPHDEIIVRQIPGQDVNVAETARQAIRDADSAAQAAINGADNEAALRDVLVGAGIL